MTAKILVFTKVKPAGKLLVTGLEKRGFTVTTTGSRKKMLAWTSKGWADFLIVDASSNLEDGLDLCRKLRKRDEYARIILVTPNRRELQADEIDASFVAPITLRKVLRRIKILNQEPPRYLISAADVTLDPKDRRVLHNGDAIHLTPKETRLLRLLMLNAGSLVYRKDIMKQVWDTDYTGDMRTIDVHIRWLRKKLEPTPSDPIYIRTVRGKGYWFDTDACSDASTQK